MKWTGLKRFSLLPALLFFFFSGLCSAQELPDPAEMTDQQIIQELMSNLEKRKETLDERENLLSQRENELTLRENDLNEREALMTMRSQFYQETSSFYQNYKKDQAIKNLEWFGIGFLSGFAVGNYTGFKIAINIKY